MAAVAQALSPGSPERAVMLRALLPSPSGDPRLVPLLRPLLRDPTIVLVDAEPVRYGPVAWLAAAVLAAERRVAGGAVDELNHPGEMALPLTAPEVRALAAAEGDSSAAVGDLGALARRHASSPRWPRSRLSPDGETHVADDPGRGLGLPPPSAPAPELVDLFDPGRHVLPPDSLDVRWRVEELCGDDPQRVADALPRPPELPTRAPAVVDAIRARLDDHRLAVVDVAGDTVVAEVAWLAAHALAWELRAIGDSSIVEAVDVRPPVPLARALDGDDLPPGGVEEREAAVRAVARTAAAVPLRRLELGPDATLSPIDPTALEELRTPVGLPSPLLGDVLLTLDTGGFDDLRAEAPLRRLLSDRRILVAWLPTCVGELRWFAALALAGVLRAAGRRDTITVEGVPAPRECADLVPGDPLGDRCGDAYRSARDSGRLTVGDLVLRGAARFSFSQGGERQDVE